MTDHLHCVFLYLLKNNKITREFYKKQSFSTYKLFMLNSDSNTRWIKNMRREKLQTTLHNWLSSRNFFRGGGGGGRTKSITMQISFVMLIFLLFSNKISGGEAFDGGQTASGGRLLVEERKHKVRPFWTTLELLALVPTWHMPYTN